MKTRWIIAIIVLVNMIICSSANSQSESLRVISEGLQFKDGSQQLSAAAGQNPGSEYDWNVYVEYSNGIIGDIVLPNYEEHSKVLRVHHEMSRKLNSAGIPSSSQNHKALLLRKDVDQASISLYSAFKNNLTISTITLKYTRSISGGTTEKYRITLNNVKIAEIYTDMNYDELSDKFFAYDTLRLIYQDITFQHFSPNASEIIIYQF